MEIFKYIKLNIFFIILYSIPSFCSDVNTSTALACPSTLEESCDENNSKPKFVLKSDSVEDCEAALKCHPCNKQKVQFYNQAISCLITDFKCEEGCFERVSNEKSISKCTKATKRDSNGNIINGFFVDVQFSCTRTCFEY